MLSLSSHILIAVSVDGFDIQQPVDYNTFSHRCHPIKEMVRSRASPSLILGTQEETMAAIAEWTSQRTLKLPEEIAARFRPLDRFFVWVEGDTLCLKRVTPLPVTEIVAQAPEGEPLSPDEIDDIVHEVRRRRKAG
jgi:hypothetical protein